MLVGVERVAQACCFKRDHPEEKMMEKLIKKLNLLLSENAHTRVNGRVASDRTTTCAGESLRAVFKALWALGYRLDEPKNLSEKHLFALCKHWYETDRAPKTIQGYLSQLRIFSRWIGKPDLVKSAKYYLPTVPPERLRVSTVAVKSKSWAEHGIDVKEKIALADEIDWRFGLMLRMQLAFGLRRMEAVQIKPWKSDLGNKLALFETKSGRYRDVEIGPEQRQVLDLIKSRIKRGEYLGWPTMKNGKAASLEQSKKRYSNYLPRIGISKIDAAVTGHGLRAQFAENAALMLNMIPPTLGGTAAQMDRDERITKCEQVSEQMGHSRASVTTAYYGSFKANNKVTQVSRTNDTIAAAVALIPDSLLTKVKEEHVDDCMTLLREMTKLDVTITMPQVQALWQVHSRRLNSSWAEPRGKNAAKLEEAAMRIQREFGSVSPQQRLNLPT